MEVTLLASEIQSSGGSRKENTEMQKNTERAPSLGFQRPQTKPAVRNSHCRLFLQDFDHQVSGMRQVEKPCLQLGCCATLCYVVRGRACSTSTPRGGTRDVSKQSFSDGYAIWSGLPPAGGTCCGNVYATWRNGAGTPDRGQGDNIEGSFCNKKITSLTLKDAAHATH